MIYLVILIYILALVYHYDYHGHKRNRTHAFYSVMILFILLSGLRYHIGVDTFEYRGTWLWYPDFWDFHWIQNISDFTKRETVSRYRPGWIIYVMTLQTLSKDFVILQISNALLINIAIFRLIKKYTPYIFTTILIYYGTFTFVEFEFEYMREIVAVSVFLFWGFDAFVKKEWIKYYITVSIAFFIHPSSMMMFVLPLIRNLKWTIKQYLLYLIVPSIVLALAGRLIIGNMLNLLLGNDSYASIYYGDGGDSNFNYFLMYAFKPAALLTLYLCFKKFVNLPSYFIAVFFFSIFFMFISGLIFTAARFTSYIIIPDFILLGHIFYGIMKRYKSILITVPILVAMYAPNIFQYQQPLALARHYPYRSILDPTPNSDQSRLEKIMRLKKFK